MPREQNVEYIRNPFYCYFDVGLRLRFQEHKRKFGNNIKWLLKHQIKKCNRLIICLITQWTGPSITQVMFSKFDKQKLGLRKQFYKLFVFKLLILFSKFLGEWGFTITIAKISKVYFKVLPAF